MGIDRNDPEIQFAIQLIRDGSKLARSIRAETTVHSRFKSDRSPVTHADMAIQALAGALLETYLPGAVLVAEEDTEFLRTPEGAEDLGKITSYVHSFFPQADPVKVCEWIDRGRGEPAGSFWTLDPIDGTKGFLRGGQYATALAFIQNGKVERAALGCPELELGDHKDLGKGVGIFAVRGQGCWAAALDALEASAGWVRLEVSEGRDARRARMLESFEPAHRNGEKNRLLRKALGILKEPVPMDSMAKHAVIASGDAEIFFRIPPAKDPGYREKIWDVAAGALAVEEAGGRVTDLEGRELDFGAGLTLAKNPGFLATNGYWHEAVLEVLRRGRR